MEPKLNPICLKCKNYIEKAELSFACYSKKCPSTNKIVKIDGIGWEKCRKPNWNPGDINV